MHKYIKNYPRPQFVRNDWMNLNGTWDFYFDDQNRGELEKYYIQFPMNQTITVPFTYETELSGIKDETVHHVIWYHRTINVSKQEHKKMILHFEGSDYHTKIWVNGNYIGDHTGGYDRFSYEIDNYILDGENEITVRVEDSLSQSQPRGKQRYKNESFKCWYVQTTGIWKTVWLESVNSDYLKYVKNTPNYENGLIDLEVETNISEKAYCENSYDLEMCIYFKEKLVSQSKTSITSENQKITIPIAPESHELKKWSLEEPNLYDIEYRLYKNNELMDVVYSYFGVRKISIKDRKIFLNEKELYQKLILDQGYWGKSHLTAPDEDALKQDIETVIKFGFNGVRKHQKVEDERFLYWCDVLGVLVWHEMANCYQYNSSSLEAFTNQWMKVVKQNYNHPSIITWVPINESWGVREAQEEVEQQSFINSLYYLTKSMDSTRLVIANDGWEHTISDVITIHDYKQSGDELKNLYIDNPEKVLNGSMPYNGHHRLMIDNYKYNGQPIILSEYGGIALDSETGWGYGKQVKNEDEFFERYHDLTTTIKEVPYLSGYCYTQLTDVQQEINGLVDSNRNHKFSETIEKKITDSNQSIN